MKHRLIAIACMVVLLCSACESGGVAGSRRGISGTWCPYITEEEEQAYMDKAAEIMLKEYGLVVSSKEAKTPVIFSVSRGALPANQKDAMERMDAWEYQVFVCTKDGAWFDVDLAYESMELKSVSETSGNFRHATGSFTELKSGEYYGVTETFRQKAETEAPRLQELLLSKDVDKLQAAMTNESWEAVGEEDIEALFAAMTDGNLEKGACMPEIQVDDSGNRTDYLQYRYILSKSTGESLVVSVKEIADGNDASLQGKIVNITVRPGDNNALGTAYEGINVRTEK